MYHSSHLPSSLVMSDPEAWADARAEELLQSLNGLVLLTDAAGIPRIDALRVEFDSLTGSDELHRWVPIGEAYVETYAALEFRMSHWYAVPGAFFDGTGARLADRMGSRTFKQARALNKINFTADHEGHIFRYCANRVAELDVRDEVLGTTVWARPSGKGDVSGPTTLLVGSPQEGIAQLSAWNEERHGSPAGAYNACTHALGNSGVACSGSSFNWVTREVYEALLAAAPERSSIVATDEGVYREFACPHKDHSCRDGEGRSRPYPRAVAVDLHDTEIGAQDG